MPPLQVKNGNFSVRSQLTQLQQKLKCIKSFPNFYYLFHDILQLSKHFFLWRYVMCDVIKQEREINFSFWCTSWGEHFRQKVKSFEDLHFLRSVLCKAFKWCAYTMTCVKQNNESGRERCSFPEVSSMAKSQLSFEIVYFLLADSQTTSLTSNVFYAWKYKYASLLSISCWVLFLKQEI